MKYYLIFFILLFFISCQSKTELDTIIKPSLDLEKANSLYGFSFNCIDCEFPHKPGHIQTETNYPIAPHQLHPALYRCFDWLSAVHGHWVLVTILANFSDFEYRDEIIIKLTQNSRKWIAKNMKVFIGRQHLLFMHSLNTRCKDLIINQKQAHYSCKA